MKQSILIIVLIIIFNLPKLAFTQQDSSATGINIKVNPFQWYYDDIRVFAEYPFNKNTSLQLRLGYHDSRINPYHIKYLNTNDVSFYNSVTDEWDTVSYLSRGFMIGLGYNYYLRNGWYVQPSLLYKQYYYVFGESENWANGITMFFLFDETEAQNRSNFYKRIYSLECRYGKAIVFNRFLLDLYAGAGIRIRNAEIDHNPLVLYGPDNDYEQIDFDKKTQLWPTLHLGLNIGWIIKK